MKSSSRVIPKCVYSTILLLPIILFIVGGEAVAAGKMVELNEYDLKAIGLVVNKPVITKGSLIYAPITQAIQGRKLLVLCKFGVTRQRPSGISHQVFEFVNDDQNIGEIFEPQFSSDGKKILFKAGFLGSSRSSFNLYVWDLLTNDVREVIDKKITFREIKWSPNGQYLAYIVGGDVNGDITFVDEPPIELHIFDLKSHVGKRVAIGMPAMNNFVWGKNNLLYYSIEEKIKKVYPKAYDLFKTTVNTYVYSVQNHESKLLIEDAFRPLISSNNKTIVYFGRQHINAPYPTGEYWDNVPYGASITVSGIDGGSRNPINSEQATYPQLLWMNDSINVVSLKQIAYSPNATAEIRCWNTISGKSTTPISLSAKDDKKRNRGVTMPQFKLVKATGDGFIMYKSEVLGVENIRLKERKTLYKWDMTSRELMDVCTITRSLGVDWN